MASNSGSLKDHEIVQLLDVLQPVPDREPNRISEGRSRFIKEARDLQTLTSHPVSDSPFSSLKVWMDQSIRSIKMIKENPMLLKFSAVLLVITMFFGGAGTAVQAASGSLPGQPLYPLKIMVEDMQGAATNPVVRVQKSLQRVETRIQEILRLRKQGEEITEAVYLRLENQIEQTQRLMLMLSKEEFKFELLQVQERLLNMEQIVAGLQNQQGNEDADLNRLRTMLQERLKLLGDGTEDPEQVRLRLQERDHQQGPAGTVTQPANGQGAGPGPWNDHPTGTCTPLQDGTGPGPGPNIAGTGTPAGNMTGTGPGPSATVEPGTGTGTGPGPGQTPTPGNGPGPGPGDSGVTPTGAPVQDGTGPGPGPGAGNPTSTCTPVQDGTGTGPGPGGGSTATPGGSSWGGKP